MLFYQILKEDPNIGQKPGILILTPYLVSNYSALLQTFFGAMENASALDFEP